MSNIFSGMYENEDDYWEKFSNMDESKEDLEESNEGKFFGMGENEEFPDTDEDEDYTSDGSFGMNEGSFEGFSDMNEDDDEDDWEGFNEGKFSEMDENEDYPSDDSFDISRNGFEGFSDMNEDEEDSWGTFNGDSEPDIFGSNQFDIWDNGTGFREENTVFGNDDPWKEYFDTHKNEDDEDVFSDDSWGDIFGTKAKNTLDSRHKALICMTAVSTLLAVFFGIKAYKK